MLCPKCSGKTEVIDNAEPVPGKLYYRRRKCVGNCSQLFTTYEIPIKVLDELSGQAQKLSSDLSDICRYVRDKFVASPEQKPGHTKPRTA